MWRRFTAHRMILWGGTLLFRAQIYGNVLCFPAAGNAVKIKSSCVLNSWRRTEKLYLRVSYCKILLTSKSQAFFLKTNQQKTRSKTHAVGFRPDVFDSMRNGTGGSSKTDLQEMPFVCSLRKERRHLPNIGLPIRNVKCTNFLRVAKCSLVLNGHFKFYGKFSP